MVSFRHILPAHDTVVGDILTMLEDTYSSFAPLEVVTPQSIDSLPISKVYTGHIKKVLSLKLCVSRFAQE
jgi:hypothetical protein